MSGVLLGKYIKDEPITIKELQSTGKEESSKHIRERVDRATQIQRERYKGTGIYFNGELEGSNIDKYCYLYKKEQKLMENIFERFKLSVRSYQKIIKVARTIADLKNRDRITITEIAEAISFRFDGG